MDHMFRPFILIYTWVYKTIERSFVTHTHVRFPCVLTAFAWEQPWEAGVKYSFHALLKDGDPCQGKACCGFGLFRDRWTPWAEVLCHVMVSHLQGWASAAAEPITSWLTSFLGRLQVICNGMWCMVMDWNGHMKTHLLSFWTVWGDFKMKGHFFSCIVFCVVFIIFKKVMHVSTRNKIK